MTKVKIKKASAEIVEAEFYTSGMVGAEIAFQFSEEWNGLTKTVVFKAGNVQKDVLNVSGVCTIPHEVLASAGERLIVGVYGTNGNDVVIPTAYANLGRIKQGADPSGDQSTDPSLPVWAQLQSEMNGIDKRVDKLEKGDTGGTVKSVNGQMPDEAGNVEIALDDYAKAKTLSDLAQSVDESLKLAADERTEIKEDLGNLNDLETTDKSNLVAAINEVKQSGGGGGWTDEQIDLLEAVFEKLAYTDAQSGVLAAQLIESLRGGVIPEEPITITFDGTKAVISGLGNTAITYSVTTAKIGYMPL